MPQTQATPILQCRSIAPQFAVPNVVTAAEYYRDALGFRICGYFGDPPVFAIVARDQVEIQFGQLDSGSDASPNVRRREDGLDAYIWVCDADLLYAELSARGAKILAGPVTREYQCYELLVEDIFGFRLVFAVDLASSSR